MEHSTLEGLTEVQKLQYLTELGLEPIKDDLNKEILKHPRPCFMMLKLIERRDRCFRLMREEYREIS